MYLATPNSQVFCQDLERYRPRPAQSSLNKSHCRSACCPLPSESPFVSARTVQGFLALIATLFSLIVAPAAATSPIALATKAFQEARARFYREPRASEAIWQFARASFDLAEFATNSTQRAELAENGITACRQLLSREPFSAPGHYYLGMNLAQLARTKGIGALKIVKEMEREFSAASELDERFDYAGPDRNLGLLYRDAPSTISIGSRTKAKQHLERAVELSPDYPENRLNLLEAFSKWSDRNGVRRELKALDELWPRARSNLTAEIWTGSWADWEQRLKQARKKDEEPSKAIESPRHKD